jgi:hypothetical protein
VIIKFIFVYLVVYFNKVLITDYDVLIISLELLFERIIKMVEAPGKTNNSFDVLADKLFRKFVNYLPDFKKREQSFLYNRLDLAFTKAEISTYKLKQSWRLPHSCKIHIFPLFLLLRKTVSCSLQHRFPLVQYIKQNFKNLIYLNQKESPAELKCNPQYISKVGVAVLNIVMF